MEMVSIPLAWMPMDWSPMEPLQPEVGSRERLAPSWCGTCDRIVAGVGFRAPMKAEKRVRSALLRTPVRRAIITVLERAAVRKQCWANQNGYHHCLVGRCSVRVWGLRF